MSNTAKLWIAIVIVVILVIIGWLVWGNSSSSPAYQNPSPTPTGTTAPQTSVNTQTSNPAQAAGLSTATSDNSDAALQSDMSSVDTQMNGLSTDSASADQSINSQPASPTAGL